MFPSRAIARSELLKAARSARVSRCHPRFQYSQASSSTSQTLGSSINATHYAAGAVGGLAVAAVFYGSWHFSASGKAARAFNKTAAEVNKKYQAAATKLQQTNPEPDQVVDSIKQFCYSYVAWIPGGRQYVDTAFNDVEKIRKNHREEVDEIMNYAYRQFQDVSKSGLSLETARKALEVLADMSQKVGALVGDAMGDIIDNHPQLKEKLGGSFDQLKNMGDQYGPEAKKQVDETWGQVKDVMANGLSAANLDKVRKLVEEKVKQVKKLGDEAWKKGMEQANPYFDKNPKIKDLVEKNADDLKQGNVMELFKKAKDAAESGETGGFEDYVKKAVDKTKSSASKAGASFDLENYFDIIPSGSEILQKIKQMKDLAEKHSEEGEKLLKETAEELKQVLDKKSKKAKEIAEKAKKEGK